RRPETAMAASKKPDGGSFYERAQKELTTEELLQLLEERLQRGLPSERVARRLSQLLKPLPAEGLPGRREVPEKMREKARSSPELLAWAKRDELPEEEIA